MCLDSDLHCSDTAWQRICCEPVPRSRTLAKCCAMRPRIRLGFTRRSMSLRCVHWLALAGVPNEHTTFSACVTTSRCVATWYKFIQPEQRLGRFIAFMECRRAKVVTRELALEWAMQPTDRRATWSLRSLMYGICHYLRNIDLRHEVPASAFCHFQFAVNRTCIPTPRLRLY